MSHVSFSEFLNESRSYHSVLDLLVTSGVKSVSSNGKNWAKIDSRDLKKVQDRLAKFGYVLQKRRSNDTVVYINDDSGFYITSADESHTHFIIEMLNAADLKQYIKGV